MFILIEITTNPSYAKSLQVALVAVMLGGFVVATVIGSIGWYASKRPAGWEDAETPGWIAQLTKIINKSKSSNE